MKNGKPRKSILKRWWFWVIVAALVVGMFSPKSKTDQPTVEPPKESPVQTSNLSFTLSPNEAGAYGEEMILNAGTEDEYHFFAFHIPAGDYRVSYNGTKGAVQLTFCKDGIFTREDGIEEIIGAEQKPIVVMAGETYNVRIDEGQYVKLSDGTEWLTFEKLA